ncbi:hypothetical protein HK101_003777 [Irineochytrium annulatum]|nr:hypothetical protein HK101_003777 [Irineochytrium annulatum]
MIVSGLFHNQPSSHYHAEALVKPLLPASVFSASSTPFVPQHYDMTRRSVSPPTQAPPSTTGLSLPSFSTIASIAASSSSNSPSFPPLDPLLSPPLRSPTVLRQTHRAPIHRDVSPYARKSSVPSPNTLHPTLPFPPLITPQRTSSSATAAPVSRSPSPFNPAYLPAAAGPSGPAPPPTYYQPPHYHLPQPQSNAYSPQPQPPYAPVAAPAPHTATAAAAAVIPEPDAGEGSLSQPTTPTRKRANSASSATASASGDSPARSTAGARPYRCPIDGCQSIFSRRYNCIQHFRTHAQRLGPGVSIEAIERGVRALKAAPPGSIPAAATNKELLK